MQEEKKNDRNGEQKKGKPYRKHGYFIAPPESANVNSGAAPTADAAKSSAQPQKNAPKDGHQGGGRNKNHRRNDRRPQHAKNTPEQTNDNNNGNNNNKNNNNNNDTNNNNPPRQENANAPATPKKKNNHKRGKGQKKSQGNQLTPTPAAAQSKEQISNGQKPTNNVAPEKQKPKNPPRDNRFAVNHSSDDYEEYTLTVNEDTVTATAVADEENAPKTEVVGIRFKSSGKVYYFDPQGATYKKGLGAIVDTARGQEFGEVAMTNSFVKTSDLVPPLRAVIRAATEADFEHHKANKIKEDDAFKICNEKILEHKLDMKLIDAQYTFDNSKLLFYFTSGNRVDFRELVKDLASVFRTRIELRQIGIRDEAKIMGGLGMCGRPLCCTLFLSDFDQVSIKMAKEQNLSLNSAKISGICGRLMCCLKYEHEAYEYEIKRTPPVDSMVRTENGDGIVTEISPLQGTVKVRLIASPDVPPKTYHRDDVKMLRKKQNNDKD